MATEHTNETSLLIRQRIAEFVCQMPNELIRWARSSFEEFKLENPNSLHQKCSTRSANLAMLTQQESRSLVRHSSRAEKRNLATVWSTRLRHRSPNWWLSNWRPQSGSKRSRLRKPLQKASLCTESHCVPTFKSLSLSLSLSRSKNFKIVLRIILRIFW